jgi:hypothetical protein
LTKVIVGKDTLTTTPNHPFYVPQREQLYASADGFSPSLLGKVGMGLDGTHWLQASALRKGALVLLASGIMASVDTAYTYAANTPVYNFEIAERHNYYVGESGVLVHNGFDKNLLETCFGKAVYEQLVAKNWADTDFTAFFTDFSSSEKKALLARFYANVLNPDIWKRLKTYHPKFEVLRKQADFLTALTEIEKNLSKIDGVTMDDIYTKISNSNVDCKNCLVQDLFDNIGDENVFKDLLEKVKVYTPYISPGAIIKLDNPPSNSIIEGSRAQRQGYRDAAKVETDKDKLKGLNNSTGLQSEKIAEAVADEYFLSNSGWTKIKIFDTNVKQGSFDRVYKNAQGKWVIVECKGGTSPLKGRNGVNNIGYPQQGTKGYINSIIAELRNTHKGNTTIMQELDALSKAIEKGDYESYILRQPFDDAGALKPTIITKVLN